MAYVFSDLEGSSIETMFKAINSSVEDTTSQIIITGDILDSTNVNLDISMLINHKSFNLRNIHYCILSDINNRIKLLLGNRDLNKLKLHKLLEIDTNDNLGISDISGIPDTDTPDISDEELINNFNNGEITITKEFFLKFFSKKQIKWKYPLTLASPFWLGKTMEDKYKEETATFNFTSDFITRFKYIFKSTMAAGNLLFTIPYEIGVLLKIQGISFSDNSEIVYAFNNETLFSDNIEYFAFIVCAIFKSLLVKVVVVEVDEVDEVDTNKSSLTNIIANSSFCKGWLYTLYTRDNTSMVLLENDKYLLSHGGITKYCIAFFKKQSNIDRFYEKVNKLRSSDYEPFSTEVLTLLDLQTTVNLCNETFKKWIQDSYTDDDNNSLSCISYMTTETAELISNIYPYDDTKSQFFSPIGPGLLTLITNKNIQYISTIYPIIQIFGHKPFGFANSFYRIDIKNMLVCLDISNSFLSTNMNESYKSFNYIYINQLKLMSVSNVYLNRKIPKIPYTNIIDNCNKIEKNISILYHNNIYDISDNKQLSILNTVDINNFIHYAEYDIIYDILNTYLNICITTTTQLIYNGIIYNNGVVYFVFSIIKVFDKDFYILSYNDILNLSLLTYNDNLDIYTNKYVIALHNMLLFYTYESDKFKQANSILSDTRQSLLETQLETQLRTQLQTQLQYAIDNNNMIISIITPTLTKLEKKLKDSKAQIITSTLVLSDDDNEISVIEKILKYIEYIINGIYNNKDIPPLLNDSDMNKLHIEYFNKYNDYILTINDFEYSESLQYIPESIQKKMDEIEKDIKTSTLHIDDIKNNMLYSQYYLTYYYKNNIKTADNLTKKSLMLEYIYAINNVSLEFVKNMIASESLLAYKGDELTDELSDELSDESNNELSNKLSNEFRDKLEKENSTFLDIQKSLLRTQLEFELKTQLQNQLQHAIDNNNMIINISRRALILSENPFKKILEHIKSIIVSISTDIGKYETTTKERLILDYNDREAKINMNRIHSNYFKLYNEYFTNKKPGHSESILKTIEVEMKSIKDYINQFSFNMNDFKKNMLYSQHYLTFYYEKNIDKATASDDKLTILSLILEYICLINSFSLEYVKNIIALDKKTTSQRAYRKYVKYKNKYLTLIKNKYND